MTKSFSKASTDAKPPKTIMAWNSKDLNPQNRLFEHINRLVSSSPHSASQYQERNSTIGYRYIMNEAARSYFGLPANRRQKIKFSKPVRNQNSPEPIIPPAGAKTPARTDERQAIAFQAEANQTEANQLPASQDQVNQPPATQDNTSSDCAIEFRMVELELYLFETQIGFLVYHLEYDQANEDVIMRGNNRVKSLMQYQDYFHYVQPDRLPAHDVQPDRPPAQSVQDQAGEQSQPLPLHRAFSNVLADLQVQSYFENRGNFVKQALVFSALGLDRDPGPETIARMLYKMRRLFNDQYKPNQIDLDVDNRRETIRMFANSYWGVSLEGLANLVHLVDDPRANAFINGNYKGNLRNTYFYLYLLALHQRYALLNISIRASEIRKVDNQPSDDQADAADDTVIREIRHLKHDMAFFNYRCIFKNISNIGHQTQLYDMLYGCLRIESLLNEIDSALHGLKTVLEEEESKIRSALAETEARRQHERETAEDARRHRFNVIISVLSISFVILQTLYILWDMIFQQNGVSPALAISGITLLVTALGYQYLQRTMK